MYQEIRPSKRCNHLIDSFWTFSTTEVGECFKVLPDTCVDLIFDLTKNKGFVSGIMSNFQMIKVAKKSDLIGVRLKTENFGSLCKRPLYETKNLRTELSQIVSVCEEYTTSQLNHREETVDKVQFLESLVLTSLYKNYQRQDNLVLSVAQKIRSLKGNIDIGSAAIAHNISLRQLERRFKNYIGLTIKEFSNVVRFNHTKKLIKSLTETSLLEIAFDSGFFDHAHMHHEIKRISGENPSYFR